MHGSAQPEKRLSSESGEDTTSGTDQSRSAGPIDLSGVASEGSNGNRVLAETELDSALQLLVERAQYITGATGTALALPQGDEMVCRASAGSSAPAVGARLQVRSGLTGESIARRQLLRCDNAEADARVNLEACRALGIASIVVLPLLRKNGEVRGLFELFSDHPYAFEERDLIALERMAALTLTALDLAEQRHEQPHEQPQKIAPVAAPRRGPETPVDTSAVSATPATPPDQFTAPDVEQNASLVEPNVSPIPIDAELTVPVISAARGPADPEVAEPSISPSEFPVISSSAETAASVLTPPAIVNPEVITAPIVTPPEPGPLAPAVVPEAMRRVQKCATCGFPVSEGRTLCLDCEKKDSQKKELEKKQRDREREKEKSQTEQLTAQAAPEQDSSDLAPAAGTPEEFIPAFLANSTSAQPSWLADHVNLLAIVVLILGILVAVVVFR
jgi:putative methionine-R-sulfoxide reductase with GAF domain